VNCTKTSLGLAAAFAIAAAVADANAQWSPSRPVRLIVPFPPGGAVDVIGRIVASRLPERLGQQVVVDNRGGANAIIGTEITAKAAPDGHTILIVPAGHAITPSVTRKLPYDTLRDFAAIGLIGNGAYVLVVNPELPAKTVSEFVALAKARPGQLNYASTGHGNATHLAGELFKVMASVPLVHLPYKGAAANAVAVMQGEIGMAFQPLAAAIPQVKAGRLKGIAVTGAKRARAVPEIPTVGETLSGYQVVAWYGMLVPAGTPRAVVAYLNQQTNQVLAMPEVADTLMRNGIEPEGGTPEAFARLIDEDAASMAKLVKDAGIKFD